MKYVKLKLKERENKKKSTPHKKMSYKRFDRVKTRDTEIRI